MNLYSKLNEYKTSDIKRVLDTKITEFNNNTIYDYLPMPTIDFELPNSNELFWKRDTMVIKWDYSEPIDNLIPTSSIYLFNGSEYEFVDNVETHIKNISWDIPQSLEVGTPYHFKINTFLHNRLIEDTSSVFTVDERKIEVTSKSPTSPIVGNKGNTHTIEWRSHGTSEYVMIIMQDSLEPNSVEFYSYVGRKIGNPNNPSDPILQNNNTITSSDLIHPVVRDVIEEKFYVGDGNSYEWNVENIPVELDSVVIKVVDPYHPFVYGHTDPIPVITPNIEFAVSIGRIVTGSLYPGEIGGVPPDPDPIAGGSMTLNIFGFNPSTKLVERGNNLRFNYSTTNASEIFLTKMSNLNNAVRLPNLDGNYTIENIQMGDIYYLNAKDSNGLIISQSFNVGIDDPPAPNYTDLTEKTDWELLGYTIQLLENVLMSEYFINQSNINTRVLAYKEAYNYWDSGNIPGNETILQMLSTIQNETIVRILEGQSPPDTIVLYPSYIRIELENLNEEIDNRTNIVPN